MPQTNILEKRSRTLQQRKNRLKHFESSVNELARKQRTRRLIELGGLVVKAHLEDWPTNTLLGGLLFLKEKASDPSFRNVWTFKGRAHLAASLKSKVPVTVTFPGFPNEEICHILEILSLRYNPTQRHWEGQGNIQEFRVLLAFYGGERKKLQEKEG